MDTNINEVYTEIYKGKEYKFRSIQLIDEDNNEYSYKIATTKLQNDIDYEGEDFFIDQTIYYYVEEDEIDLPINELEKKIDLGGLKMKGNV